MLEYEPTLEGMVQSWVDRIPGDLMDDVDGILKELAAADAPFFDSD